MRVDAQTRSVGERVRLVSRLPKGVGPFARFMPLSEVIAMRLVRESRFVLTHEFSPRLMLVRKQQQVIWVVHGSVRMTSQ